MTSILICLLKNNKEKYSIKKNYQLFQINKLFNFIYELSDELKDLGIIYQIVMDLYKIEISNY